MNAPDNGEMIFYYHGSINHERLPRSILHALARAPQNTRLHIAGYETVGSLGYMDAFAAQATELGIANRVQFLGSLSLRSSLMQAAASSHVGLAFMPLVSDDINLRHMAGASNKPFDYLAAGLMLLVSDLPEWRRMFVDPGYGVACDPADAGSLATAMTWCAAHPEKVRAMGERGRQKILADWNYETAFAPVVDALSSKSAAA
jgi:glycosyltransferase involved in cell wall biosynthesis